MAGALKFISTIKTNYPNIFAKYNSFDKATKLKFFGDFENASSSVLTGLNTEVELMDIWRISSKNTISDLTALRTQLKFSEIGYTDFQTIDFLKYADGRYYGNKLIYADPTTTADAIILGSSNLDKEAELKVFEAYCILNKTKGFTPVSTTAQALDGVLLLDNGFIQIKSNNFSKMTSRLNEAYNSAKGINVRGVHILMEIDDASSNVTSVVNKWKNTASSSNNLVKNDGTISAISVKTNTGWVDLDLTLIP